MTHKPRKRFGQNFLQDAMIIEQIMHFLHVQTNDNVLEIGPGLGALTKPLLKMLTKLVAVEIDRDLYAELKALPNASHLELINQDALQLDYGLFGEGLRIIGNLPYNISTPLMLHLLKFTQQVHDMHFMLQKEVVLRLASGPGSKNYGRLSVMVQYHCEVEHLLDVPATAFFPSPKVDSAIVCLRPHQSPPYPIVDLKKLEGLVASAFSMRRKTLANNLKPIISADLIRQLDIDPGLRPEQISVADFVRLTNFISHGTSSRA